MATEQVWQEVATRTGMSVDEVRTKACVFNTPEELFNWLSAQASTASTATTTGVSSPNLTAQASPVAGASSVDANTAAESLRAIAAGTATNNIIVVDGSYVYVPSR